MVNAIERGTVKQDFYYTRGGNNHQAIYSYETKPVKTPVGNISFAAGTDYRLDDGGKNDRSVFDAFLSLPVFSWLSFKGRARTSYSDSSSSTQFRGGLQVGTQLTHDVGVYVQTYVADKAYYDNGQTDVKTGAFAGIDYKINDKIKIFVEAQAYDLHHPDRDNVGVNFGLRVSF